MRGGKSFVELVRELELHRDDERARRVDVAPAPGIFDETDVGDSFLSDVDGRETFAEVAAEIEGRMRDEIARRVNVLALAVQTHTRAFVAEAVRTVELWRDADAARLVHVAPFIVFGDWIELQGRRRRPRRCE